jgi:hypothetical protein
VQLGERGSALYNVCQPFLTPGTSANASTVRRYQVQRHGPAAVRRPVQERDGRERDCDRQPPIECGIVAECISGSTDEEHECVDNGGTNGRKWSYRGGVGLGVDVDSEGIRGDER